MSTVMSTFPTEQGHQRRHALSSETGAVVMKQCVRNLSSRSGLLSPSQTPYTGLHFFFPVYGNKTKVPLYVYFPYLSELFYFNVYSLFCLLQNLLSTLTSPTRERTGGRPPVWPVSLSPALRECFQRIECSHEFRIGYEIHLSMW